MTRFPGRGYFIRALQIDAGWSMRKQSRPAVKYALGDTCTITAHHGHSIKIEPFLSRSFLVGWVVGRYPLKRVKNIEQEIMVQSHNREHPLAHTVITQA